MKKETKSTCKNLCVDCRNHTRNYANGSCGEDLCTAHEARKTTSCISGETHTSPVRCIDHNDKGQCKLFDAKEELRLIKALQEYGDRHPLDMFCRRTVDQVLVDDLLRVVEEKKSSHYLEMVYDSDDPYSGGVVVTKKAINESVNRRGYNVDVSERGSGCYVESRTSEECRKERSWLARVKNWLAFTE